MDEVRWEPGEGVGVELVCLRHLGGYFERKEGSGKKRKRVGDLPLYRFDFWPCLDTGLNFRRRSAQGF